MWTKIEDNTPIESGIYPVWLNSKITDVKFLDFALLENGTWYLDDGDTNIESTSYRIVAWYEIPRYE